MSLENFNPYNDLIGLMRSEGQYNNPLSPLVGRITKINNDLTDIEVLACQMHLYKEDLLIDSWLLDRHIKAFKSVSDGTHIHEIKEPLADELKVNDLVLLIPYEEKFIITSKVVSI